MVATAFNEENAVLDSPPGMTPEECEMLSVYRGVDEAGNPVVISCWKPTQEEWAAMRNSNRVWLIVYGNTMPPVALCGVSPFIHPEPNHAN